MHIVSIEESTRGKPQPHPEPLSGDVLDMRKINAMPHPICAKILGGSVYEVELIDVQTGLMRINVSGLSERKCISEVLMFIDADSGEHEPDDLWLD